MNCPSYADLLDYLRGQAEKAGGMDVSSHLSADCNACQENLRWLEDLLQLAAADNSIEFAEPVIAQAVATFRKSATPARSLRQIFAQLIFDSLVPQPALAMRSEPGMPEPVVNRQLLYRAEGYDIDLRYERAEEPDRGDVIGQVLTRTDPDCHYSVQLICDNNAPVQTQTNARGVFCFRSVPPGARELIIEVPEGQIAIPYLTTREN